MKLSLPTQPDMTRKVINGVAVDFVHTEAATLFDPFDAIDGLRHSFRGLDDDGKVVGDFPDDVVGRFRDTFFSMARRVECIAGYQLGDTRFEHHLFTGEQNKVPLVRIDSYAGNRPLFEYYSYTGDDLHYGQLIRQFAELTMLRLPRTSSSLWVQNYEGVTFLIVGGDGLQVWLIRRWVLLADLL